MKLSSRSRAGVAQDSGHGVRGEPWEPHPGPAAPLSAGAPESVHNYPSVLTLDSQINESRWTMKRGV
jgi:hypothetical protein